MAIAAGTLRPPTFVFLDPPYRMQQAYEATLTALAESSLVLGYVRGDSGGTRRKFDPGG